MALLASYLVNFGGKFHNLAPGIIEYRDGLTQTVDCEAADLWRTLSTVIPVLFFNRRMWYKLSFEVLDELKLLWRDSGNFQRLCDVSQWVSIVEIYMEEDADLGGAEEVQIPATEAPQQPQNDETEQEQNLNTGVNRTNEENEEIHFAEEDRVEAVIREINDDSDADVDADGLPTTPQCSDTEEDPKHQYEKYKKGSGELKLKQLFSCGEESKEGVLEYALKGRLNIKYARWGPKKFEAVCGVKSKEHTCKWRIYCSYEERIDALLVKTFNDNHTCLKDGRCKLLTDNVIARMFVNEIRINGSMQPRDIQAKIEEKYNIVCTHDQIRKAKRKALRIIQAEYDEQFSKIKDYANEVRNSNPGSTVEVETVTVEGPLERFERFYVCYASSRTAWIQCSRPVIGIDGCFLKNNTKSQLLAVVGRDGNNSIYPIGWAVVQTENHPNWCWFISKLQQDLNLGNGTGFTLISDKQKRLLQAVDELLPRVEHRMCARHIYGNICKYHPRRGRFKRLFWDIVQSYTMADYEAALQRLKDYDVDVYQALIERNPQFCSRAFFQTRSTCEDALNNHSESYNHTSQKARTMPLVELLETMRRQAMVRIEIRRVKAMNHKAKFCPRVTKLLEYEEGFRKYCKMFPGPTGSFEVVENGTAFKVNMDRRTCTCRKWDLTGVPSRHSLRVIMEKKFKVDKYVASVFLTSTWQRQYNYNISTLVGMKFWPDSGQTKVQPPPRTVNKGRTRNPPTRIKEVTECENGGRKLSSHARVMHCKRCGVAGHYQNKCKKLKVSCGVDRDPALAKKRKRTGDGEETDAAGEETDAAGEETEAEGQEIEAEGEEIEAAGEETEAEGQEIEAEGEEIEAEAEAEGEETLTLTEGEGPSQATQATQD